MPGMPGMMGPGGMPTGQGGSGVPGSGAPPVAARPTDFAKWIDDDFHNAVRERDETVLKAIDARTKAKPADPEVAGLLAALLVTSAEIPAGPAEGQGGMPGMSGPGMSGPGGMGMPNMSSGEGAAGSSGAAGAMHGAPPGGAAPPAGAMPGGAGPGSVPGAAHLKVPRRPRVAVDSLELLLLEAATAYQEAAGGGGMSKSLPSNRFQTGGGAGAGSGMPDSSGGSGGMPGMPGMGMGMGMGMGGAPKQGSLDVRELTRNIIGNLVKNGSPVAWQTIFAVASGTMKTALDQTEVSQIVAESLFKNLESGGPQVEQVLLAILEGKAQLPSESRSVFLATMTAVSSSASDKMTGFDKVASVPAQSGGGFGMSSGMGSGLSMPGAGLGSEGPGFGMSGAGMPGMPGMGAPAAAPTPPVKGFSDAELMRAAAFIWSPKCVTSVADQLKAAADPMAAGELLKLAATIPNQKTREAMYAALSKVHSLGADALRGTGVFNQIHDPGLLVVLKTLPRPKAVRAEAQTMDSWSTTSEEMVLALRDRMKALSTQPGKLTAVNDNFPVKLHRNAISEYAGVLTLPTTTGTDLKDSAPSQTKVYYARTSFTPQKPKDQNDIKDHYEARASGVTRPDQAKQLLWIDGVKGGTTGVRRSMDVIIQPKSGGGGGFGGPGGDSGFGGPSGGGGFGGAPGVGGQAGAYSIEIIVVETADPKGSSTAAADSKPDKN